jgi:transposase
VVGYIRKRLSDKSSLNGIKLTEVNGTYTSIVCAECGKTGKREDYQLVCEHCEKSYDYPFNGAKNLLKKSDGLFKIPDEFENKTAK